jgi:hypothetical protein
MRLSCAFLSSVSREAAIPPKSHQRQNSASVCSGALDKRATGKRAHRKRAANAVRRRVRHHPSLSPNIFGRQYVGAIHAICGRHSWASANRLVDGGHCRPGDRGSYAGTFDPSEGYREAEHNFEME